MTVTFTKDTYVDDAPGTPGTGFSAARMNNLSTTLDTVCDSIHRAATFTVAANDSTAAEKASADYVCDGTDDQTEINSAINAAAALTAAGGTVQLLGGNYRISAGIRPKSNIILQGVGPSTIIKVADAYAGAAFSFIYNEGAGAGGNTNIVVRDMALDGNKAGVTTTSLLGVYLQTATYCIVDNVIVHDFGNSGFYLHSTSSECIVHKFRAYECDLYGYYVDGTRHRLTDCIGHDNDYITLITAATSSYCKISGCNIRTSGDSAMSLQGSYHDFVDNVIDTNAVEGVAMDTNHSNFIGNMLVGNGTNTDNTYANLYLTGDYNNVQLNMCRRGGGANKSKYGIQVVAGATSNMVTNNDLIDGGTTGNLLDNGTSTVTTAGNRTT